MNNELTPRRSAPSNKISRDEFLKRFHRQFCDTHFDPLRAELDRIADIAWENYLEGRKAPSTEKAGPDYQDPDYELSADWLWARDEIRKAEKSFADDEKRVLLILASDRNEFTCPGEYSKTARLADVARERLETLGVKVELLDLSVMTAEYGKTIYPCKGCVSTAMPLCHWPCSCYPNHSLGQTHDWMNEIYPMWVRAHGVMIVTPVYWHQAPGCLKLMMDRLVCADGGNTDPTSTQGKKAQLAKEIEAKGWDYPRHLKGRLFSLIVHGDVVGVNELKTALSEWLSEMELIPAAQGSILGRYIGYLGDYSTSHLALDRDHDLFREVEIAAESLAHSVTALKKGQLGAYTREENEPRPK